MSTREIQVTIVQLAMAAVIALPVMALGGCKERRYGQYLHPRDTVTLNAGDAVAHNKAVQTIDPWPAYSRRPDHTTDGKRMMVGIERYQKNESLEPEGLSTNDVYEDQKPPDDPSGPPPVPGMN